MSMDIPNREALKVTIAEYLVDAVAVIKPEQLNQKVYFLGGPQKCRSLDVLAQTAWKQVKVCLREDGKLCLVWGWHDYVNVPRPKKPTGILNRFKWFIRYHAFGVHSKFLLNRMSVRKLAMVAYSLDEIIDPLYAGYRYPIASEAPRSGRARINKMGEQLRAFIGRFEI
jgi:hypothetical protein